MSYIGIDIGTSGCKASVVSANAEIIAFAYAEYNLVFPEKGYVELNPALIFTKVKQVLKMLAPKALDVTSLALSSFGEAFVLLDSEDKPLNNFITYADSRCEGIDCVLAETYTAEKFFDITGVVPNQSFSLCKLIWLKEHCAEIIKKTEKLFLANDYFNYLLSGNRGVDNGTASKTMLLDVRKNDWSEELLSEFGIPKEWFSPVMKVGTYLGKLTKTLANELGLSEEIDIYLGCHDQCNATLGGGAYKPGCMMIGEGSTESINLIVDNSVFTYSKELIKHKMCVEPFLENGKYMIPVSFLTYGNAQRWYINTMEGEIAYSLAKKEDIFSYLDNASQKETSLIFLPNLSGVNIMDVQSRVPGAFIGITLNTERWEFYRSVIQGLNFESRINLETLKSTGVKISYISATGGITKSDLFMQLKADVLKQDIHITESSEAGIIGLAVICAVASGNCKSYEEAVNKFIRLKKVFSPKKEYDRLFEEYRNMRQRLR